MKICIIGAGAGGRSAAGRIRQLDKESQIDIFSTQNEIGYAPCEPPFVLRGIGSWSDIFYPGHFFEQSNVNVHLNTEVTDIIRREKRIIARGESHPYDKLILCPGAVPSIPSIPGLDGKREFTISSNIADGKALENIIPEYTSAAVIGAGAIGIEMTLTFASRNYNKVYMLVRRSILRAFLDDDMSEKLEEVIRDNGVELILPASIESIKSNTHKKNVYLSDRELETDFVFLATGARSNVELARKSNLDIGETGGILVNDYMQTNDPDIYAAGDCVELCDYITGSKTQHQMVTTAGKTGDLAATNLISGNTTPYEGILKTFSIGVFGHQVYTSGLTERLACEEGLDTVSITMSAPAFRPHLGGILIHYKLIADRQTATLIGAQIISKETMRGSINELTLAITEKIPLQKLALLESPYSPATGMDPIGGGIRALINKIG
ncbi:MAG: FAD-dependent oxidoreductase [Dehalococcoidales bacterium]|nr:FAD-dependent oxidoreductase [Dehalococcoidales bacterium]